MPPAGFEPATPVTERHYTHALEHAATAIGHFDSHVIIYWLRIRFGHFEANETWDRCASRFDTCTKISLVWNLNWFRGRRNGWVEVYQLMMAYDAISKPQRNVTLNLCATLHLYCLFYVVHTDDIPTSPERRALISCIKIIELINTHGLCF